ncbi:MAG: urea ABC transporter permease subunit UrtB [Gammaproteobacteria bacterium]|nr:urea ABC transporter permease subunit UrtB [Gammaproteobacteria bacterium]
MHGAATADYTLAGLVVLVVALLVASPAVRAGDDALAAALAGLDTRSFDAKARAVEAIAATRDPRAAGLLQALLDGRLMRAKADDRFVLADDADGGYAITDALSGAMLGTVGKRKLARLSINNALRTQLRGLIAEAALDNPDAATRRAAVEAMAGHLDGDSRAVLDRLRGSEPDARVRAALDTAIALYDLEQGDDDAQTAAIAVLRGSLDPVARGRLAAIAEDPEAPRALQAAASSALASIENRIATYEFLQMVFFGLSLGSVLVLAAIGLAITFGVMGVINMAHGELIMLGAYTTYVVQLAMPNHLGWSLAVAVPAAFLVAALVGIAIERGVIRFLYGRPLETLLATFGVSLVLQQAVRTIFSPLNRSVATPAWMSGSLELNSVLSLTYNRLYIMAFALIVFAALMAVLRYTRLGLEVRAVAQNRAMARAIGVRGARVDALTFGLGSGVAGVAGVALSQLTNVGPNLGQAYIVDSFMVVVFGGVGNLWGTLVAGLGLGVANKFLEPWAGAVMAKILVLVFIIVFIQKRPRGLFPQRGRAAES